MNRGVSAQGAAEPAGIYVHIPFCIRKCPYCDFFSVTDLSLLNAFAGALRKEMERAPSFNLPFDSLYIGGGTPSVADPRIVGEIIDTAHHRFNFLSDVEITLEVNPGAVSRDRLADYRRAGVNRINLGVQSFTDKNLRFLGRIHSAKDAGLAISRARKAGFDHMGLDLMYGLPGQTPRSWEKDLEEAVRYAPEHLSCYILTYEPGTPMQRRLSQRGFRAMTDSLVGKLFCLTVGRLENQGYSQYEISNFARNGPLNRSRHNQKYWSFTPYIGLGPSAHSYNGFCRWWNHRSVKRYLDDIEAGKTPVSGKESLGRKERIIEAIYLGLRQTQGIDITRFELEFGANFCNTFGAVLGDLQDAGQITIARNRCALTRRGMLFLDSIASMLVSQEF